MDSPRGKQTLWRTGSASDSRSEGCVFKSRRGQKACAVRNILLFKAVVCLGTSPSLGPLSKISPVPNGSRASVICFHSVVVITFGEHATGTQFETGWKQSLVVCLETTFKLSPLSKISSVQTGQGTVLSVSIV